MCVFNHWVVQHNTGNNSDINAFFEEDSKECEDDCSQSTLSVRTILLFYDIYIYTPSVTDVTFFFTLVFTQDGKG